MTENYTNPNIQNNEEESTLSLMDIWHMVWDYKWWYVVSTFFCLVAVVFYIYRTPDTYQRTAKVIIDESEQSSTMKSLTQMAGGMAGLQASSTVANEMEAFSSPDLMQKVVEKLNLETRYFENQVLRSVEYYQNNPVELRLMGSNPQKGFSFTLVNKGNNTVLLKDFVIGPDDVEGEVECTLGQTVATPAGDLAVIPTMYVEEFENDVRIGWNNSMARAKAFARTCLSACQASSRQ